MVKESGFHNGNVSKLEENVFLKCVLHTPGPFYSAFPS